MDDLRQVLDAARLLLALSALRKGRNAREIKRNIPPQVKHQRVLDYLRRFGMDVGDTVHRVLSPTGVSIPPAGGLHRRAFGVNDDKPWVRGEAPSFDRPWGKTGHRYTETGHHEDVWGDTGGPDVFKEPSFPHAHEASHLQMTPPGRTAESYQNELDTRRGNWDEQPYPPSVVNWAGGEEEAANLVENGIWRRAGAGTPVTRIVQNQWRINGREYKRHSELAAQKRSDAKDRPVAEKLGRPVQRAWDEGRLKFGQGGVQEANTVDARINARAAGQTPPRAKPEPSRAMPLPGK